MSVACAPGTVSFLLLGTVIGTAVEASTLQGSLQSGRKEQVYGRRVVGVHGWHKLINLEVSQAKHPHFGIGSGNKRVMDSPTSDRIFACGNE